MYIHIWLLVLVITNSTCDMTYLVRYVQVRWMQTNQANQWSIQPIWPIWRYQLHESISIRWIDVTLKFDLIELQCESQDEIYWRVVKLKILFVMKPSSTKAEFGSENYNRSKLGISNRKMDKICAKSTSNPVLKLIRQEVENLCMQNL